MREKTPPLVSVVVPVYNTEDCLRECLDSLTAQTLDKIEIVCVDDGSTDGSLAILDEYREKDPRVLVATQKNAGVSVARNRGVELASGKYLCFVDSDDSVAPDYCLALSSAAEKIEADVARFYGARELRKVQKRFPKTRRLLVGGLKDRYENPTTDERRLFVYLSAFRACWSCLYRREFWLANGIQFPPGIRLGEDTLVNFLASAVGKRFAFFEGDLYRWRKRPGSASHPEKRALLGVYADSFEVYREARDYFSRSEETKPLLEPLAEFFAFMQRNVQIPLSAEQRALWRQKIEEVLDDSARRAFFEKGALPGRVAVFWRSLYGRNIIERAFCGAVSSVYSGARRFEALVKERVVLPLRASGKKSKSQSDSKQ
ncbi:MAG: glycosyltransferase [Thermoguttaceae bacterium]|nr:glycosyltransferase [Thermoguttaceae bacterium]